jgi:hypothetical protein
MPSKKISVFTHRKTPNKDGRKKKHTEVKFVDLKYAMKHMFNKADPTLTSLLSHRKDHGESEFSLGKQEKYHTRSRRHHLDHRAKVVMTAHAVCGNGRPLWSFATIERLLKKLLRKWQEVGYDRTQLDMKAVYLSQWDANDEEMKELSSRYGGSPVRFVPWEDFASLADICMGDLDNLHGSVDEYLVSDAFRANFPAGVGRFVEMYEYGANHETPVEAYDGISYYALMHGFDEEDSLVANLDMARY